MTTAGTPERIDNRLPRKPGRQRRPSPGLKGVLANARSASKGVAVGKPKEYSPELCDHAIALGMKGHTWASIAMAFGVSRKTINEWEANYPAFSDAMARARVCAQAFLENHGRKNLKADRYQAQVWSKLIAVHEDYREQRSDNVGGFDLGSFVGAIAQAGAAAALAGKAQPGDGAKVISGAVVKDDATLPAQDMVAKRR